MTTSSPGPSPPSSSPAEGDALRDVHRPVPTSSPTRLRDSAVALSYGGSARKRDSWDHRVPGVGSPSKKKVDFKPSPRRRTRSSGPPTPMVVDVVRRARVDTPSALPTPAPPPPPHAVVDPVLENRAPPSAQSAQPAVGPAVTPSPDSANPPSGDGARPASASADATNRASSSRKAKSGKSGKQPKFNLSNKFINNIRPDYETARKSIQGSTDCHSQFIKYIGTIFWDH